MTKSEITSAILNIFDEQFEIENPSLDADLRETYEFDSIDAIELLVEIERMIGAPLSQEDKKLAMEVRTINDICDYIESMAAARA